MIDTKSLRKGSLVYHNERPAVVKDPEIVEFSKSTGSLVEGETPDPNAPIDKMVQLENYINLTDIEEISPIPLDSTVFDRLGFSNDQGLYAKTDLYFKESDSPGVYGVYKKIHRGRYVTLTTEGNPFNIFASSVNELQAIFEDEAKVKLDISALKK